MELAYPSLWKLSYVGRGRAVRLIETQGGPKEEMSHLDPGSGAGHVRHGEVHSLEIVAIVQNTREEYVPTNLQGTAERRSACLW
jgi:hypothetical protein